MAGFDPYSVLDIPRAANDATIKSAYRRAVQTAHPDRGGDPDHFITVVKAFGLLSDPAARRLYDYSGIVDEDGVRSARQDVRVILADMFDAAVQSAVSGGLSLSSVDFIEQMRVAVETGLNESRRGHSRISREIEGLETLRHRIRRSDEEENLFVVRLDGQITDKQDELGAAGRRVALLETAMVELGNYRSETELIAALEAVG